MSRTIRRKTFHAGNWPCPPSSPDYIDGWDIQRHAARDAAHCLEKMRAKFHADHAAGQFGVPRWYRRELNRRVSRLDRHELRRCLNQQCWDDHLPTCHHRSAGYYWW